MENIIEIKHLHKSFKDVHAVNDLSLRVKKGEFFAFLGINGAGKSTTISIMCGKLKKDEGEVLINGYNIDTDLDKIKSTIDTKLLAQFVRLKKQERILDIGTNNGAILVY